MSDYNQPQTELTVQAPVDALTDVSVLEMLQDMVLDSSDVDGFLTNLAKLAAARFSSPDAEVLAAVTLLRPRTKATVASSTEHAQKMDEVQYAFNDGPCLRAAREELLTTAYSRRLESPSRLAETLRRDSTSTHPR